ncbi:hypothetical protein NY10_2594 (plasmid) [Carnobacterium antarcticum]|nr:hypothetical protein NY10_2594 [Carnobacterium sp. CP1]
MIYNAVLDIIAIFNLLNEQQIAKCYIGINENEISETFLNFLLEF